MSPKRIAFIKRGQWSHTNASVAALLERVFPDHPVDIITLRDLEYSDANTGTRQLGSRFLNRCFAMKEFAGPLWSGKKRLVNCLPRTTYAFRCHRHAVEKYLSGRDYLFTFQTQNLFDASLPGIPHFVYTDHCNIATLQYPGYTQADLWSASCIQMETSVYSNARIVFTFSDNIAEWLVKHYPVDRDRVACVHAGSNTESRLDEPAELDRYTSKRILFVGTSWDMKGGPVMLEAFRTVLAVHPDAHLTIVGSEPGSPVPNCTVAGRLPLAEVGQYYQDASLFCLPTRIETFGISFVEAMAHRLPVIGPRLGAIPEFIKDGYNGHLTTPGNPAELADKLLDLMASPEKGKAFGDAGYRMAMQHFNWDAVGRSMREHIERAIR